MTKKIYILGALAVIALLVSVFAFYRVGTIQLGSAGIGQNHYQSENFLQGLYAGTTGQFQINNSGAITTSGGLTIGSSGTAVTNYKCASATWDPPSLGTSTVAGAATSTDIALSGAALGDECAAGLTSATSTFARVNCVISATGTSTIQLLNASTGALDLGSGTAEVCYTH